MKLMYVGKNIEIRDSLKALAEKKFAKLDKYFASDVKATVTFSQEKNEEIVEVTINLPGGGVIRSEEAAPEFTTAIDKTVDVLQRQIRKHKTKLQKKMRGKNESIRFDQIDEAPAIEADKEPKIIRKKTFDLRPMSTEEATLQMDLLGHNFFVYRDSSDDQTKVVYKRKDGNFGLLEPQI
ncbi:MAG: ribosome-associated translation inhibitor RaiA [Tissierellia bacterium]|nr:ribosome-associated translation inhibitor RaiA [Tissierellia bacterium]